MVHTRKLLNPAQTGREAERLEADLRKRVIGQEEAIQQVLRVYQTHLAGLSSAGTANRNPAVSGADRFG